MTGRENRFDPVEHVSDMLLSLLLSFFAFLCVHLSLSTLCPFLLLSVCMSVCLRIALSVSV